MYKDKTQKLVGIFILALILLNFPIIGLFSKKLLIFNAPVLLIYILATWLLIIGLTAYTLNATSKKPQNSQQEE